MTRQRIVAGSLTAEERGDIIRRLWAKTSVDPATGCWVWTGSRSTTGYGLLSFRDRMCITSRLSLMASRAKGVDRPLWVACHKCDNPPCWNPDHLWAGTPKQNSDDKIQKGRSRATVATIPHQAAEDMCRLHYTNGWSLSRIAKDYGLTASDVDRAIQRSNRQDLEAEWEYVRSSWKRRNDE